MASDQSTLIRNQLAKDNEDRVIAQSALEMERIVSWVRLATVIFIGVASRASIKLTGLQPTHDLPRFIALLAYLGFTIGTLITLRRVTPSMRGAFRAEMGLTVIDFAFMTFMAMRSYDVDGFTSPAQGAIIYALLICFSLGRVTLFHVLASWALACGCFVLTSLYSEAWETRSGLFVLSGYTALMLLVASLQRRIRQMFVDLRRRDNLTRFLPAQIAEEVMTLGEDSLQPVQREVTVLFSDIRDFTTLSESMPPGAVLAFLDEYFRHMAHLVKEHEGIVNKFLGDGMLAFWGVPHRNPRHAELAVRAALDMRKVVEELNEVRRTRGAPPIRIGIGIHTGPVAAGMLGGADQHEYTVIGDAVNVASRVEGLTKQLGVDILVSESTWRQLAGAFSGERFTEQYVKGRQEAVVVYAVHGRLPRASAA